MIKAVDIDRYISIRIDYKSTDKHYNIQPNRYISLIYYYYYYFVFPVWYNMGPIGDFPYLPMPKQTPWIGWVFVNRFPIRFYFIRSSRAGRVFFLPHLIISGVRRMFGLLGEVISGGRLIYLWRSKIRYYLLLNEVNDFMSRKFMWAKIDIFGRLCGDIDFFFLFKWNFNSK